MVLVTILGSCRQHSISQYFNVTSIQEDLDYPHYSKEVLQCVQFLKDRHISDEQTRWCFRSGLLTKRPVNYFKLQKEFLNTDVFVIEIASRITYEYQGLFMHHIAKDEPQYEFYDRDAILVREQTDQEIEEDILKIMELLSPKRVIIISHITTYNYGKRYELAQLLETICKKYNIQFWNPSVLLEKYSKEELFNTQEKVLAHYTDFGHRIVGLEYKRLIES